MDKDKKILRDFTGGWNLPPPSALLIDERDTPNAVNVLLDGGGIETRGGVLTFQNTRSENSGYTIKGLYNFIDEDRKQILVASMQGASDVLIKKLDDDLGWTNLTTGGNTPDDDALTKNHFVEFATIKVSAKNHCYLTNGINGMRFFDNDDTGTTKSDNTTVCSIIGAHRRRLWGINATNTTQLHYSKIDDAEYDEGGSSFFFDNHYFLIGDNIGEHLMGLWSHRTGYLIFQETSTWLLGGYGKSDWRMTRIHKKYGCMSHRSICQRGNNVFWLSRDGWAYFDGEKVDLLPSSRKIKKYWYDLGQTLFSDYHTETWTYTDPDFGSGGTHINTTDPEDEISLNRVAEETYHTDITGKTDYYPFRGDNDNSLGIYFDLGDAEKKLDKIRIKFRGGAHAAMDVHWELRGSNTAIDENGQFDEFTFIKSGKESLDEELVQQWYYYTRWLSDLDTGGTYRYYILWIKWSSYMYNFEFPYEKTVSDNTNYFIVRWRNYDNLRTTCEGNRKYLHYHDIRTLGYSESEVTYKIESGGGRNSGELTDLTSWGVFNANTREPTGVTVNFWYALSLNGTTWWDWTNGEYNADDGEHWKSITEGLAITDTNGDALYIKFKVGLTGTETTTPIITDFSISWWGGKINKAQHCATEFRDRLYLSPIKKEDDYPEDLILIDTNGALVKQDNVEAIAWVAWNNKLIYALKESNQLLEWDIENQLVADYYATTEAFDSNWESKVFDFMPNKQKFLKEIRLIFERQSDTGCVCSFDYKKDNDDYTTNEITIASGSGEYTHFIPPETGYTGETFQFRITKDWGKFKLLSILIRYWIYPYRRTYSDQETEGVGVTEPELGV